MPQLPRETGCRGNRTIPIRKSKRLVGYTPNFAVVIVSHELPEIFDIATRVAMLHNGTILEVDTAAHFPHSSNPAVQQFIAGRLEGPLTPT